ncbi:MAG: transcriptional regulator Spx [Leuconostoc gelidum]|uniref:Transcriptional regulator Spx n=1 Tax=Leuconostoc gelidum subsp. gelidum TaxID=1607839 RepID=A0AB35G0F7_LEUGE|nr:transcriptional regulator Spx [Leuconostoc gelidum]AFS40820.1 regulatory protein spx [Leuconostoc gelidum JB7]MBZ5963944.1 transcriptional regulator Spx [Leuconostoc gelidum subsp. gelidum]MBZ5975212.1 transcriptional regulator Spx [Leuconostoc gelidum subsp. gelidum]MBZ5976617.1 transcriptional regulator Spx [Leuconostoc gelidum subsp. gelidum]MBZ5978712.1 transcriptional regulator Spx [Leuconostoc gelidum subsp. gelidum]
MITLFSSPSCTSCRKAKLWLENHNIPYIERDVNKEPLRAEEVKEILRLTEDGTEELISKRSKIFSKLNLDLDSMSINKFIELIVDNPSLLKRPIIMDDHRMQVGYNDDEIRRFLPRDIRQRELIRATFKADFEEKAKDLVVERD